MRLPSGWPLVPLDTRDFPSRPSLSSSRFVLRFRNRSLPGRLGLGVESFSISLLEISNRRVLRFFSCLYLVKRRRSSSSIRVNTWIESRDPLAIIDRCIEILVFITLVPDFISGSILSKRKKRSLILLIWKNLWSVNNDNRSIVYFLVFLVELYIKTDAISSVYEVINIHKIITYAPLSDKSKLSVNDIM